jgi:hypothetical protein
MLNLNELEDMAPGKDGDVEIPGNRIIYVHLFLNDVRSPNPHTQNQCLAIF